MNTENDIEKIGECVLLHGVFALVKSSSLFKYAPYGRLTSIEFIKTFRPNIFLHEKGTYMGDGIWMIQGGDLFREALIKSDGHLLFSEEHPKPVEMYDA